MYLDNPLLSYKYTWISTVCNTPDDGRKLRPKYVEFEHQMKERKEKLHLVGIYMTSKTLCVGPHIINFGPFKACWGGSLTVRITQ